MTQAPDWVTMVPSTQAIHTIPATSAAPLDMPDATVLITACNALMAQIPFFSELQKLGAGSFGGVIGEILNGAQQFATQISDYWSTPAGATTPTSITDAMNSIQSALQSSSLYTDIINIGQTIAPGSNHTAVDFVNGANAWSADLLDFLGNPENLGTDAFNAIEQATAWVNSLITSVETLLNAQNLYNQISSDLIGMVPYSHIGGANPNLLTSAGFDTAAAIASNPGWSWNSTAGHTAPGCAQATANGTLLTLNSPSPIQVTQGQQLTISAWVNYTGLAATAGQNALRINAAQYAGSTPGSITQVAGIASPSGSSGGWVQISGTYTVPAGVDNIIVQLQVTTAATAGTVLYDDPSAAKTGLMSGNWMSGIAGTITADLQSAVDQIFHAGGGTGTGNPLSSILASLTNQPGTNIATPINPGVVPNLDASKIVTGVLNILHIPTSSLGIGNITDLQSLTDAISNAFQGVTNLAGTTIPQSSNAMSGITNTVVQNSTAIQALMTEQAGTSNSGQNFAVSFANYSNGAMPNIFTTNYAGSGGSTIGISGGQAVWNMVSGADRSAILIYNGANASPVGPSVTNTDYQLVGATVAGAMGTASGQTASNYLYARVKDTSNYVYARYYTDGLLNFYAELGCVVAGVKHVFATNIHVPITTTQWLYCGTGSGLNYYQLMSGTQVIYTYNDAANVAGIGAAFRGWGWGGATAGSGAAAPSAGTGVSCADNAPPTVIGSGALMVRRATATVALAAGPAPFPANFFDTVVENSADITPNAAASGYNVANSGWYMVNMGCKLSSTNYSAGFSMCLYRNGTLFQVVGGNDQPYGLFNGCFLIYLNAGDGIQAGYMVSATLGTLTGEATGAYTFFTIALVNKSLA